MLTCCGNMAAVKSRWEGEMKEQTKCREHTEMFLCLKEGHSDTGSNLDKLENAK